MDGINGNMNYESFVASAESTYGVNKGKSSTDLSRSELKKIFDKYANSDGDASTLNPEEQDKAFAEMREYVSQLLLKCRGGFPQKPQMGLVENRIYRDPENDTIKTVTVKDGAASVKSEYYNKKIDGFLVKFKFVSKGDEEGKDKFVPMFDPAYKTYSRYKKMFDNLPKEVERNALNQYKNYSA